VKSQLWSWLVVCSACIDVRCGGSHAGSERLAYVSVGQKWERRRRLQGGAEHSHALFACAYKGRDFG
jgi:hypothetical protein